MRNLYTVINLLLVWWSVAKVKTSHSSNTTSQTHHEFQLYTMLFMHVSQKKSLIAGFHFYMTNENFEETYLFYKSLNKTWIHFWIWRIISSYIPNDFRGWEVFDSNSGILHRSSSVGVGTSLCCHRSLEEEKVSTTPWQDKWHTQQGFAETSEWICGLILAYREYAAVFTRITKEKNF